MNVVFILILAALVIIPISIARAYASMPLLELKRRARDGDSLSKSLYKVASYKFSSQFLLWLVAALASAGFFVVVDRKSPAWLALTLSFLLIWVAYIWIPRSSVGIVSKYLAQVLSGPLSWLLRYIHPSVSSVQRKVAKPHEGHTGIYESSDLTKFLNRQKKQLDNRVANNELDMLAHVLELNKLKVSNVMIPKRKVRSIAAQEKLSPIVLDELYKTGHLFFPVYDEKPSNIVGILNIFDVVEDKSTPLTSSVMDRRMNYVHEDQQLHDLLRSIISTRQQFFIVINSSQEYAGIVTTNDVLKTLVGDDLSDNFNQYDSKQAVSEHFSNQVPLEEENEDKPTTEVIE